MFDTNDFNHQQEFKADICILGGGVAGLTIAKELASSQNEIIIIESGSENYQQDIQDLYKAETVTPDFSDPLISRLRMLGGSSNHWENSNERLDRIDFEKREWVNNSGWPINYDDLITYYEKAEDYCGIGTDGFDLDYWKKKIPFNDFLKKSKNFKTSIIKAPIIPTRFYQKFKDDLLKKQNIRIIKNANIIDLDYNEGSGVVSRVKFRNFNDLIHSVTANKFVMCFGGIENSRLLLSFNEKYNNTLGNEYSNVGRYVMEHPTIRGMHYYPFKSKKSNKIYQSVSYDNRRIHARLKLKESIQKKLSLNNLRFFMLERSKLVLSHGISSMHIVSDSLSDEDVPDDFGIHISNILGDLDLISEMISRKTFDKNLFDDSDSFGGYQFITMLEQTPNYSNKIILGDTRDALGVKKVKIDVVISKDDKIQTWKTLKLLSEDSEMLKNGRFRLLEERESRLWASQVAFGQHHMGGTRMSLSSKEGVVDKDCKVFGTKNLYIAGSSIFPTGGHVPPTLTIVALAIRLAKVLQD